jgi:hypothetical protein
MLNSQILHIKKICKKNPLEYFYQMFWEGLISVVRTEIQEQPFITYEERRTGRCHVPYRILETQGHERPLSAYPQSICKLRHITKKFKTILPEVLCGIVSGSKVLNLNCKKYISFSTFQSCYKNNAPDYIRC